MTSFRIERPASRRPKICEPADCALSGASQQRLWPRSASPAPMLAAAGGRRRGTIRRSASSVELCSRTGSDVFINAGTLAT
jgi:hypothetical protein